MGKTTTNNIPVSTKPGFFPTAAFQSGTGSTAVDNDSENKQNWQQQKEEQARNRKRKNDLKKTEDEIHQLETRNEEIEVLLTTSEVYTNVQKLIVLNNEKKSIEERLLELMELWEQLAAEE